MKSRKLRQYSLLVIICCAWHSSQYIKCTLFFIRLTTFTVLYSATRAKLLLQSRWLCKYTLLKIIIMDDIIYTCPKCENRTPSHSYTLRCKCCLRNFRRNCTQFSHHKFEMVDTDTLWYCRLCNENIFESTARKCTSSSLFHYGLDRYQSTKIFYPLEISDDDSDKIEYQCVLDPDKNSLNQITHHLSKSSNYYIEEINAFREIV